MKKVLLIGTAVTALMGGSALAAETTMNGQRYSVDGSGNLSLIVAGKPYDFTPLTPDQHNLAITSSTALTIPTGAFQAVVCAAGNSVKYTYDGTTTPTASVGMPLANGQCIQFSGATVLANLRFI